MSKVLNLRWALVALVVLSAAFVRADRLQTCYRTADGLFPGSDASVVSPDAVWTTEGGSVTVTAYPFVGQYLSGWYDYPQSPVTTRETPEGKLLGTENPIVIEGTNVHWLAAHFDWITYRIQYRKNATVVSTTDYHGYEDEVELAAFPSAAKGYHLASAWTNEQGAAFAPGATVTGSDLVSDDVHANKTTVVLTVDELPNEYVVAYDIGEGGAWPEGAKHPAAAVYDVEFEVSDPVRYGYVLKQWREGKKTYASVAGVTKFLNLTNDAGAVVTLTAEWEPVKTTVRFNEMGATSHGTDEMVVTFGVAPGSVQCPSSVGKSFLGYWTDSPGGLQYWDGAGQWCGPTATWQSTNATMEVFAHWRKHTYHLAFDGNGGSGEMEGMDSEYNVPNVVPANGFERIGYTFVCWADTVNGTTYQELQQMPEELIKTGDGDTRVLTAVWATNTYWLAFDPNGGESRLVGKAELAPVEFLYDAPARTLPDSYYAAYTLGSCWEFVGWSNTWNNAVYTNGTPIANAYDRPGTNRLVAVWKGGTGMELSSAMHCDNLKWTSEDEKWQAVTNDPSAGYVPSSGKSSGSCVRTDGAGKGLKTALDGRGVLSFYWKSQMANDILEVGIGSISTNFVATSADTWQKAQIEVGGPGEVKINAKYYSQTVDIDQMTWMPDGSTLHFEANGGTGAPADLSVVLDAGVRIPWTEPTLEAHVFRGWQTNGAEAVEVNYRPGDWYENPATEKDTTNTLTAVWVASPNPEIVPIPAAATGLIENGQPQTGVAVGAGYSIVDNVRTSVGTYVATARLTNALTQVWSDGTTTDKKIVWSIREKPQAGKPPVAVTGLVYDGTPKTGVAEEPALYALSGHVATNAGSYTATAVLKDGYVWKDGGSEARSIVWSIAKAAYDMSGVSFPGKTFTCDGQPKSLAIEGTLPAGVTVSYVGNGQTAVGEYLVTARFSGDTVNHEMIASRSAWLKIVDPSPGPGPGPGPSPEPEPTTDTFEGNATYLGWLESAEGKIAGTVSLKAGKAKARTGLSQVSGSIVPLGGKKITLGKRNVPVGEEKPPKDDDGLYYYGSCVSGTVEIAGASYALMAYADQFKSSDKSTKAAAKAAVPAGTWTFALNGTDGRQYGFSAAVAAKTAKTKVSGVLPGGGKVSASASGVYNADRSVLYVPFVYAKRDVSLGFVLTVGKGGDMTLNGLDGEGADLADVAQGPSPLAEVQQGAYVFETSLAGTDYAETADGFSISPAGEDLLLLGTKLSVVDKTVGSVKAVDGKLTVSYKADRQVPANLSKLKLKYAAKTGVVTGSFALYRIEGTRLKTYTATVNGVLSGNRLLGHASVKKTGETLPVGMAPRAD